MAGVAYDGKTETVSHSTGPRNGTPWTGSSTGLPSGPRRMVPSNTSPSVEPAPGASVAPPAAELAPGLAVGSPAMWRDSHVG